jgi:hypothetical protein
MAGGARQAREGAAERSGARCPSSQTVFASYDTLSSGSFPAVGEIPSGGHVMAGSSEKPNAWLLWPLLAVFLVVTGYIQLVPRLGSSRPGGEGVALEGGGAALPVRARLWEDPLSAVAAGAPAVSKDQPAAPGSWIQRLGDLFDSARKSKPAPGDRSSQSMQSSLFRSLDELNDEKKLCASTRILVLLAMIDGGPYPEDLENRRRTRVAVISALGAEGFTPRDADHLGYFVRPWHGHPAYVPFEWFEPPSHVGNEANAKDADDRLVLLLWLNESAIGSGFLHGMTELSNELDHVFASFCDANLILAAHPEVLVRVLGPSDSDVLESMVGEAEQQKGQKTLIGRIYSSQSTAESARRGDPHLRDLAGIPLESVIGTDRDLATALGRELHLRNSCTADPANQIAIIAESDTLYGQDVFRVFDQVFQRCKLCGASAAKKGKNVRPFTYFQGIDGRLPGDKRQERSDAPQDKDATIWREPLPGRAGTSEPAVGYPRLDYLHRTIDDLARDRRGWKAIGVVGSDVYDKILLIRVLRYYFPGTILFTTDLDARLLDPAEYPSTHNLLIASHYGLELRHELQRDVPPFRSTYQTSVFFATVRAMRETRDRDACKRTGVLRTMTVAGAPHQIFLDPVPVVFEVGRTGVFPLEFRGTDDWIPLIEQTAHPAYFVRSFWPLSPFERGPVAALALLVVCGLAVFFLVYRWSQNPALSNDGLNRLFRWIAWLGIVSAAVLAAAIWDHLEPEGEPFRLFDGISVWPSELLRLCAGFFAAGSIVRGVHHLKESDKELKPFFAEGSTIWSSYHRDAESWRRWRRVIMTAACYLVFAAIVSSVTEHPYRPVRGGLSDKVDLAVLYASVIATVALLCFVVDATVLSESLVRKLRDVKSEELSQDKHTKWAETLGFAHPSGHAAPLSEYTSSAVSRFLGVKLIAKLTNDVGTLIYYPAVALVLLFLSRNRAFDNWDWPPVLVVTFAIGSLAVVACGVSLRITAARARRDAIKKLDEALVEARLNAHGQDDDPMIKAIKAATSEVNAIDEGAYSSIYENPVIRAVLVPLAGVAGLVPLLGQLLGINL